MRDFFTSVLEISLEQAVEAGAVARLVLRHLVDGVVDGVVAQLLRALGDRQLARAGARFRRDAQFEVLLGRIGDALAQQFRELGCVLRLFKRIALVRLGDLGIPLALGDARHSQIHADFGALALEVRAQTVHDLLVQPLRDADFVLAGKLDLRRIVDGDELRRLADGADLDIVGDNFAADRTSLHDNTSLDFYF